jgi:DNA polymerase III subunit delta
MQFDQILNDLKKGTFRPIYLLMGEEAYYIDLISDYIAQHALNEADKAFNQTILYGRDVDAAAIINAAKRYPMMCKFQVVIVREAQQVKNIDDLIYYVTRPNNATILVICYKYKKLDKRKKLYKEFEKAGVVFESNKLYESQVPDWITGNLKEKGYSIQPAAALLLTEFVGNDLQKIDRELGKLIVTLPKGEKNINTVHIEQNIGISKDYNSYELQKALTEKNALKSFRIAEYMGKNQKSNPFSVTIASLYFFFNKVFLLATLKDKSKENVREKLNIQPFFFPEYSKASKVFPPDKSYRILHWLREYDLKSKGVENMSATPHDLLRELVYKILQA